MLRLLASLVLFGLAAAATEAELTTEAAPTEAELTTAPQDEASCTAAGGTWYADRVYCVLPSPPPPPGDVTSVIAPPPATRTDPEEACVEGGGTWYEDRQYCAYPAPPPPGLPQAQHNITSLFLERPALTAAAFVGPAGVVGGRPMCCMAYNFQCLACSMGAVRAALVLWGKQIAFALATPAGPIAAPRECCRAYTFECLRCEHGVFRAFFMMIGI